MQMVQSKSNILKIQGMPNEKSIVSRSCMNIKDMEENPSIGTGTQELTLMTINVSSNYELL